MRKFFTPFIIVLFTCQFFYSPGQAQTISTVASGLYNPEALAVDRAGNIYFPDSNRVKKVNTSGMVTIIAGTGVAGFAGDGGPATSAEINTPFGIYADLAGNIFIGSSGDSRIRKIDPSGNISTFAGTGVNGYSGDGGPATGAAIAALQGITGDAAGNIYFTDFDHAVVRKINTSGIISTIAGTGVAGYSGDGGPATAAQLGAPNGISLDAAGNIYISDDFPNTIRKIDAGGLISTVAGNNLSGLGSPGNAGDGGPATSATFGDIESTFSDPAGNIYIIDAVNSRVRRLDGTTGIISAFAGNGMQGFAGDGGPAQSAEFNEPWAVCLDTVGNYYIGDAHNQRIRKVTIAYSIVSSNLTVNQTLNAPFSTDINDDDFHRLVTITPTAGGNVLSGNVAFQVTFDGSVQTASGQPYVQRHYDITPTVNASTAQATVKLYFLQSEFDAYNTYVTAHSLGLPLLPAGGVDNGNIAITQFHGSGTAPGNYTGASVLINPSVVWNAAANWWELSFPVTGFSGFFVTTGSTPLPLNLLSFTGTLLNSDVTLQWTAAGETDTRDFVIERNTDPTVFAPIGTVNAFSTSATNRYSFVDKGLLPGTYYYRLIMVDKDGHAVYSRIISIKTDGASSGFVLYPNPVNDRLFVQVHAVQQQKLILRIADMQGRIMQIQELQLNQGFTGTSFNTAALAAGSYMIIASGGQQWVSRFIKK